jgi:hypothetical protein
VAVGGFKAADEAEKAPLLPQGLVCGIVQEGLEPQIVKALPEFMPGTAVDQRPRRGDQGVPEEGYCDDY